MTQRLVARANIMVLSVLVSVMVIVGGFVWAGMNQARQARLWSQHANDVLLSIKDLSIALQEAETGQRGYLLTGRDSYLDPYNRSLSQVTQFAGQLQRLTADDPAEQARILAMDPILQRKLAELAETIAVRRVAGVDAAQAIVNTDRGRDYSVSILATLHTMTTYESQILRQHQIDADHHAQWTRWLMLAGLGLAALGLVWAARMLNTAWEVSTTRAVEQQALALQLRSILDSLTQGVGVFAPDFTLTHWNAGFQDLLGLPKALVRAGTSYAALVDFMAETEGAVLETEDQLRVTRSRRKEVVSFERALSHGRQIELRRAPVPDGGFVLTISDMTRRAQAEGVLRESQKMQAIGQLTGGIAHDFNNLLTVILGNIALVRSRLGELPKLEEKLGRAAWAAQRGATLTQHLLAFARKQPLSPKAIDLAAELPNLIPLLTRTLGEHIDVRHVDRAGLWPAMADGVQLENAVLNLALNARDAMPDGGRLTIETANIVLDTDYADRHSEVVPGEYAMVAVSDTGHGIPADIQSRVCEPFFTTKPEGRGTGLGLAMVFGFVKQSGGHLKIYSEPGEGTTVRIYLPRATGDVRSAQAEPGVPVVLARGSATIMVVEDEADVRQITVEILRDVGYRVFEAATGDEGLRLMGAHVSEIDLLLTDVVLPGELRGRDLAERLSAMRPEVPVLYMSGYTENSIVHHGRLDEGVNLLGKPFSREQLALRVSELLNAAGQGTHDAEDDGNVVELKSR